MHQQTTRAWPWHRMHPTQQHLTSPPRASPPRPPAAPPTASQALNYASAGAGLASIFMFKFSVTLSTGNGVTKNGIHWGDNTGAPYNIGDSTLAAEGFRLVAERLAGAKPIQNLTSVAAASLTDAKAVGARRRALLGGWVGGWVVVCVGGGAGRLGGFWKAALRFVIGTPPPPPPPPPRAPAGLPSLPHPLHLRYPPSSAPLPTHRSTAAPHQQPALPPPRPAPLYSRSPSTTWFASGCPPRRSCSRRWRTPPLRTSGPAPAAPPTTARWAACVLAPTAARRMPPPTPPPSSSPSQTPAWWPAPCSSSPLLLYPPASLPTCRSCCWASPRRPPGPPPTSPGTA